ncbi:hypothetical protein [Magnetospira thiophila]
MIEDRQKDLSDAPLCWGEGKQEVSALREQILALMCQGLPVKRIHEQLTASGKIRLARSPFYRHVNTLRSEAAREEAGQAVPVRTAPLARPHKNVPATTAPTVPPVGLPSRVTFNPQATPDLIARIWDGDTGEPNESDGED